MFYIGLLINLFCSYGMYITDIRISESISPYSFTGRILHGLLINILIAFSFHLVRKKERHKWALLFIIFLSVLNIYLLVPSRTGQIISTALLIISLSKKYTTLNILKNLFTYSLIILILSYLFHISHESRIFNSEFQSIQTIQNTDQRFSFYINGSKLIIEKPLLGYGLGNIEQPYMEIKSRAGQADIHGPTDNLHSQFIQTGVESGVLGAGILCLFLLSLLAKQYSDHAADRLSVFSIVMIQNSFNSSFMDHGDSWMLTLLIAFFIGKAIARGVRTSQ